MKRALVLLVAALLAGPALGQTGRAAMDVTRETVNVDGSSFSFAAIPPPASATLGCVGVFLGSPLNLQCAPASGLVYTVATKSLDVTDGRVQAGNLRAIPLPASGAVTVAPKLSPIGGITVVAGSALVDGDSLSVGDGAGVVPIEFDAAPGDGTTGGAVPIVFDGTETATEIRDAVKAILDAATRDWTTSAQGADGIGLVRATPGATGGAITETVTAAGFLATDWTNPTAATTYTYSLQACLADGACTAAGAASSTAAGVATLSAAQLNRLSWSAVSGAASYKIRRDVGGATQGVIWSGTALAVDDTGLAGDGSAKPTVDGTGTITGRGVLAMGSTVTPGTGTAVASVGGVLHVNTTSQATTGTSEEVLATYTLPANTLSASGKAIRVTAWGTSAANGNTKIVRIRFGGIGGTQTSAVTWTGSGSAWKQVTEIIRTGATTQESCGQAHGNAATLITYAAPTQTLSGAVDIVVTATTPTAAGDVTFKGLIVEALN